MQILDLVTRAIGMARAHFERASAIRDLQSMSDHQLRDIGISRDQIDIFVRNGRMPEAVPQALGADLRVGAPANHRDAPAVANAA